MPIISNPVNGVGTLYIGPNFSTLSSLSNNSTVKVTVAEEEITEPNYMTGQGSFAQVKWIDKVELAINPSDLLPSTMAMALFGSTAVEGAGTATGETVTVTRGATSALANSATSLTTVTHSEFSASAWAATTAYAEGDFIKEGASPAWILKCTTGGTSAGVEPTWSTTDTLATIGTTETDGTVVWTYVSRATLVSGTDYTLAADGGLSVAAFARITNGHEVLVTYDYVGYEVVEALLNSGQEYCARFVGKNRARGGSAVIVDFYRVKFGAAKELSLLDPKSFATLEMTGTLLPDTSRPTGTSQYFTVKMAA